jgi:hypothetical protein
MFQPRVHAAPKPIICTRLSARQRLRFIIALPIELTGSLVMLIIVILATAALVSPRDDADPLALLETLISNDYRTVLNLYPQRCPYAITPATADEPVYCEIYPDTGPFQSIAITLRHRLIEQLYVTSDGLQVRDLVHRWGRPNQVRKTGPTYTLIWGNRIHATVNTPNSFTYQASVQSISLALTA